MKLHNQARLALHFIVSLTLFSLLSGCSSYGVISNIERQPEAEQINSAYSIKSIISQKSQGNLTLALAFSGGGTRASALAYGVLQELNDTQIKLNNQTTKLIDEVDVISAVSGGSFTAAYYGLHGPKTFKNFEHAVLKKDIEDELISQALNPFRWFADTGRTEMAVQLYNQTIFDGATFADLNQPNRPLILINASDLGNGLRFSFVQEYFNFLCSDINQFSIARAVAASSAVPVVFNPIVVKNFQPCQNGANAFLHKAGLYADNNDELKQVIHGLQDYTTTDYPYLQLVDGGITDNLGLRAIYETIELSGGPNAFMNYVNKQQTRHIVIISVDASAKSVKSMRLTNKSPSLRESVDAMTDIQIHRYNTATQQLFKKSLSKWQNELTRPGQTVESHFIQLNFDQIKDQQNRQELNLIPTSLSLTEEQVSKLIKTGRQLLKNNLDFQLLLRQLDNTP